MSLLRHAPLAVIRRLLALGGILLILFLATAIHRAIGTGQIYPGEEWSHKAPEEAGFSASKLGAFSAELGGTGCIVHGGEVIHEWGKPSVPHDAASATKVFYTYLTLKAVEDGLIESLDERVGNWAPELRELNPHLDYKDRDITFHHLLSQTSGYGLVEKPGEAFAYNDHATGLLAWALFHRVHGRVPMDFDEVINSDLLGDLIEFEKSPTVTHRSTRRGRLRITARDLARFGLLHLRGGRWEDRQVLRKRLFRKAMQYSVPAHLPHTSSKEADEIPGVISIGGGKNLNRHLGSIGYFWWHNRITPDGTRLLPDIPACTFMSIGHGGRFALVIIPKYDLVAVWLSIREDTRWHPFGEIGRFEVNAVLRDLLAARRPRRG